MRRIFQLSVLCLAASIAIACELDQVIRTEDIPTAGVRFINAVPDSQPLDFRFVDMVESNAHWNIAFRNNPSTSGGVTSSTQIQYKPARAGSRHFRIFLNDTLQAAASQVIKDTTVTLEADKNYTALLMGFARTGSTSAMRLMFLEDNPPDPLSQVALRVINTTSSAIDVRAYPSGGPLPTAATWANVPPLSVSAYVQVAPSVILFNVQPAGGGFPLFANAQALVGAPAEVAIDPLPGTTIAGSAVSAVVFPGSVVGSRAPQTGIFVFTTGSAVLSATATGYARAAGSFITDGFLESLPIVASGFANPANNGASVITAVTATALTVTKTPATVVEKGTTGAIAMAATPTGYVRTTGSFIADGFVVGQAVVAGGFLAAANNGQSVITAMTDTELTVTKTPQTVTDAAAPDRTIVSAGARRIVGPTSGRPAISFVWDRRPPRI